MLRRWAEVFKELEERNASLCTGDSGWEGGRQSGAWRPLGIFKENSGRDGEQGVHAGLGNSGNGGEERVEWRNQEREQGEGPQECLRWASAGGRG